MLDLGGDWWLADLGGEIGVPMPVPGDVYSALLAAGVIADPYFGRNETIVRWVADRDWVISRTFTLEEAIGPHLLVVDELDTVAEVRINGELVLAAASAFHEHIADVSNFVAAGDNRIEILIKSPIAAASALQAAQPYPVPYHTNNSELPNGNMLRKPQCDFGWDWNIALASSGIYGRIQLVDGAGEIAGVTVRQRHEDGIARVEIEARLRGFAAEAVDCSLVFAGQETAGPVPLLGGAASVTAAFEVADPDLWWPNGVGRQALNDLVIRAGATEYRTKVALRDIKLVSEPDAVGRSFRLNVNGRDLFARGANWIPSDALGGRISPDKTRQLLMSAVDAHMTMIRVWGGGRYEPDWFYDMCDELGLMIWQDAMFSCNLYPATPEFLGDVADELTYQTRRLAHRVAIWCGDNELIGALLWFEESRKDRDRYLVAYDRLNRTVETAIKSVDPAANWWPSSPSPGPLSFGDTWHDDKSGDMHFWSVWHEGRDFEHYRDVRPRFCSEFGFQSYTSMDVIRTFASEEDFNIASPVMEAHQKNKGGNARIAETMFRYFRFPKDFASFVWLSQVQQALAIKTAVDYWRSLKPHCMGTLYWQLNDTWPVQSWSSLDYGGGWKLLHYAACRFFQPVNVAIIPAGDDTLQFSAVNDTLEPVAIALEFAAVSFAGTERPLGSISGDVGPDAATTLAELAADALGETELLVIRWQASNGMAGTDHFAPRRYKEFDLPNPGLSLATTVVDGIVKIRISAEAPALYVTLEADAPGRFSDNAVLVVPGRDVEVAFVTPSADPGNVTITARDLYSSFSLSAAAVSA
ncbi:MAG: glycoside hydrolase family 2 protein [Ancalomicrobiaceae bacterium]|nr:glycoside hydrolase family 2 protein [Ancalomicrobiaceae bacterium]